MSVSHDQLLKYLRAGVARGTAANRSLGAMLEYQVTIEIGIVHKRLNQIDGLALLGPKRQVWKQRGIDRVLDDLLRNEQGGELALLFGEERLHSIWDASRLRANALPVVVPTG